MASRSNVPSLRANVGTEHSWDDPSEDLLLELLLALDRLEHDFLIVERATDPTGGTYAQVILLRRDSNPFLRKDAEGWVLERREGGPEAHFSAAFDDVAATHRCLVGWAFGAGDGDLVPRAALALEDPMAGVQPPGP